MKTIVYIRCNAFLYFYDALNKTHLSQFQFFAAKPLDIYG